MRKKKSMPRFAPYWAGLAVGYCAGLAAALAGALIMMLAGADSGIAWLPAVVATALGSFLCGRTAGRLRRRDGLKTGALCGVLFIAPLILLGFIFGRNEGVMLPVKLLLSLGFAAAGGVAGVNSPEK